tara:strand:+ start:2806 stop:2946 length:141 start_codon:yes stop_codon:yes gene_type:complete
METEYNDYTRDITIYDYIVHAFLNRDNAIDTRDNAIIIRDYVDYYN